MSIEERTKRKSELNDELNKYKKKWNIVEANRNVFSNINDNLQRGQNKSQKTFSYHLRHTLIDSILGSVFLILPATIPIALFFFLLSGYNTVKMAIFAYCFFKLKKGVKTLDRINDKFTEKKQQIEKNESMIYQEIALLENHLPKVDTTTLFERCIERTALSTTKENDLNL